MTTVPNDPSRRTSPSTPIPLIRWDHLLLAMDVVAHLAQKPDRRKLAPRAVERVLREQLRWFPKPGEAYDLSVQLDQFFGHLRTKRAPDGIEDFYNVTPLLAHFRERAARSSTFANPDGLERLLRAIASGELTEANVAE